MGIYVADSTPERLELFGSAITITTYPWDT